MYCIKCGKYIESDNDLCEDCAAKQIEQTSATNKSYTVNNTNTANNTSTVNNASNLCAVAEVATVANANTMVEVATAKSKTGSKENILKICLTIASIIMCIVCLIMIIGNIISNVHIKQMRKVDGLFGAINCIEQTSFETNSRTYKNYKDVYVAYKYVGNEMDTEEVLVVLLYNQKGYNFDYVYTICRMIDIEGAIVQMREKVRGV